MSEPDYEARKAAIIADTSKFQRVCSTFVGKNVEHCMSSLMYDISQNLQDCARIFDFDYDEALGWFQQQDWEEPVRYFIFQDADLDQLQEIVELCDEDWDDILDGIGYNTYLETQEEDGNEDPDALKDWLKGQDACHDAKESFTEALKQAVWMTVTDDYYDRVGNEFNLDVEYREVYEHWLVDRWFAARLRERGEVVFEFCNMTIWGRCTTGQAISIDGVVEGIVKDLSANHWVWGEA